MKSNKKIQKTNFFKNPQNDICIGMYHKASVGKIHLYQTYIQMLVFFTNFLDINLFDILHPVPKDPNI